MGLSLIDWSVVFAVLLGTTILGTYTNRYMRSVADFLSANRCAGRYMLTIAEGESRLGVISLIAMFQLYYEAGFTGIWWYFMGLPVGVLINLTGWVIYRLRETRCLTLAEFFEMRYGRKFRVFSGILAFICGVLYFGIFPAVVTNFFIHFCGLPQSFPLMGLNVPTFPILMALLLFMALYFTFIGGQIAIMVTDFIQGMFTNIVVIAILCFIFYKMQWSQVADALLSAPENASLLDPHKTTSHENFNPFFFFIGLFFGFYGYRTSQTSQGYGSSALTPHEGKMGTIIGTLRGMAQNLMIIILPIAAYTILKNSDFSFVAEKINLSLNEINNEEVRNQMIVPIAMRNILPLGLKGAFCAIFLAAFITTHNTFLHAWGSTFIQDVIMPLRKSRIEPQRHMNWLRWSIIGVAVFIFLFSLFFEQKEHLLLWLTSVSTISLGGTGIVLIGGLYWKRANAPAAWAALITGAVLSTTGIIIRQINPDFFLNGMEVAFWASITSVLVFVIISFMVSNNNYNLDKMLHRGEYAVADDVIKLEKENIKKEGLLKRLGLTKEFTKLDITIYLIVAGWSGFLFLIFVIGTIGNLIFDFTSEGWAHFWYNYVKLVLFLGLPVTIWITVGGIKDMSRMFKRLKAIKRDTSDDGWVEEEVR